MASRKIISMMAIGLAFGSTAALASNAAPVRASNLHAVAAPVAGTVIGRTGRSSAHADTQSNLVGGTLIIALLAGAAVVAGVVAATDNGNSK
jgi:hypothetical protein